MALDADYCTVVVGVARRTNRTKGSGSLNTVGPAAGNRLEPEQHAQVKRPPSISADRESLPYTMS
jgi:hypothetical protein